MAGQSLFVAPDGLDAGAGRCDDAATSASSGAQMLQDTSIGAGIFGDFDAAHGFHAVAAEVHSHHVDKFASHKTGLTGLSGKGRGAAEAFADSDAQSGELIDRQMHPGR